MRRILFLLLIGLLGTGTLVSLGVWQVKRLGWKQDVVARIDSRISADPVALPEAPTPEADEYIPVLVDGVILDREIRVLASRKQIGAGYRIIAPFQVGDRTILVDRGFLEVADENVPLSTGPAEITGNLHWPDEVDGFTPDPDREAGLWFARDVDSLSAELGTEPVLLIAATRTDPNIDPMPVDTAGIPNDHMQYAITWFSLALIWLVMTFFFARRQRASETRG